MPEPFDARTRLKNGEQEWRAVEHLHHIHKLLSTALPRHRNLFPAIIVVLPTLPLAGVGEIRRLPLCGVIVVALGVLLLSLHGISFRLLFSRRLRSGTGTAENFCWGGFQFLCWITGEPLSGLFAKDETSPISFCEGGAIARWLDSE
jgi:hypothetical protein